MNNNCTFAISNPDPNKMLKGFYSGKEKPFSDGNSNPFNLHFYFSQRSVIDDFSLTFFFHYFSSNFPSRSSKKFMETITWPGYCSRFTFSSICIQQTFFRIAHLNITVFSFHVLLWRLQLHTYWHILLVFWTYYI